MKLPAGSFFSPLPSPWTDWLPWIRASRNKNRNSLGPIPPPLTRLPQPLLSLSLSLSPGSNVTTPATGEMFPDPREASSTVGELSFLLQILRVAPWGKVLFLLLLLLPFLSSSPPRCLRVEGTSLNTSENRRGPAAEGGATTSRIKSLSARLENNGRTGAPSSAGHSDEVGGRTTRVPCRRYFPLPECIQRASYLLL